MRMPWLLAVLLLYSSLSFGSHHRPRAQEHSGQAGQFDFYVFVLSWSPEFCYSHANARECSDHRGFVVHGLWPQNNDGTYPLNCETNQLPPSHPETMADIMPPEIIEHEWREHGTCSGLSGDAYFALIRNLHGAIRIPSQLQAPSSSFAMRPFGLKRDFESLNPELNDSALAIQLRNGRYLNAVEICVTKSAKPAPTACSGVRDANAGTFLVPPVR